MKNLGLDLNVKNASFSWNYFANQVPSEMRNVACNQKPDGTWQRKLSQKEAVCYWTNYPAAGLSIQKLDMPLNAETASGSWNFIANTSGV